MVEIRHGDFRLEVRPECGGSVTRFTRAGIDVLRPASSDDIADRNPLGMASFPLFPFSGRINGGLFRWAEQDIQLKLNFPPERHAIHGQAWQAEWHVVERSTSRIVIAYDHAASDWPWHYRAEQELRLDDDGLSVTLSLVNLDQQEMPAGLGWHPYFPRQDAEARIGVTKIWRTKGDELPESSSRLTDDCDLSRRVRIADFVLDNAFVSDGSGAELNWPSRNMSVRLSNDPIFTQTVVYIPEGENYFCVEPVSHVPNAFNLHLPPEQTGLRVLRPGERMSGRIRIDAAPLGTDELRHETEGAKLA